MVVWGAVVVTVMVVFTIVFGPVPLAGLEVQVVSAGKVLLLQAKVTAVVNPVEVTMPTVVVPDPPGLELVTFVGPETPAKPGWIVKLTGVVLLLLLKLASPP